MLIAEEIREWFAFLYLEYSHRSQRSSRMSLNADSRMRILHAGAAIPPDPWRLANSPEKRLVTGEQMP